MHSSGVPRLHYCEPQSEQPLVHVYALALNSFWRLINRLTNAQFTNR
jgi:hypothetical protein